MLLLVLYKCLAVNKNALARHAHINWQLLFSLQKVFTGLKVLEIVWVPLGDW